jgi:hypothetical protein
LALNEKTAPLFSCGYLGCGCGARASRCKMNIERIFAASVATLTAATAQGALSAAALFHPVSFHFTPMFFLI